VEIPAVEEEFREADGKHGAAEAKADQVRLANAVYFWRIFPESRYKASENLTALKSDLREIESLKRVAVDVSRLNKEVLDLGRDISNLESELAVSGSTQTTEDVQAKMDELSNTM
jgi:hypothetical protein